MKANKNRDYTILTQIAAHCGLVPYEGREGSGKYSIEGLYAPVDLSACAEDEKSILKTTVKQLSEQVDEHFHSGLEKNFND